MAAKQTARRAPALWRAVYRAGMVLFVPLALARLAWRRRGEKRVRPLAEYLGRYPKAAFAGGAPIWIHAVSVGEANAAIPLILRLSARGETLLLTHLTASGYGRAWDVFGDAPRVYFAAYPLDCACAVGRFLRRFRPRLGVVMETELWPQMFSACRAAGVPLLLANARLSKRSARGYARIKPIAAEALSCVSAVAAQSRHDARRLRFLGAERVVQTGNLKFDRRIADAEIKNGEALRAAIRAARPGCKILLFASTRAGEEEQIAAAFAAAAADSDGDYVVIAVPRHPRRGGEVAAIWRRRGLRVVRRGLGDSPANADVLVGDTLGEMAAYCAAADAVFVGGSLPPAGGGQSPLEAMALAKPVVVGPRTANFAAIVKGAIAAGAAARAVDAADAVAELKRLAAADDDAAAMGAAGKALFVRGQGATAAVTDLIDELLAGQAASAAAEKARR